MAENYNIENAFEAVLISSPDAIKTDVLSKLFEINTEKTENILKKLQKKYSSNYGFILKETVLGWQFYSSNYYANIVGKYLNQNNSSLSMQAIETLAIIAYKQPITRAEVSEIRGVNSDGVIKKLILYKYVNVKKINDDNAYDKLVTTDLFLHQMGIKSLEELEKKRKYLPELNEIDKTKIK